ncbi:hypothetical protein SPRG_08650 [Saprolegnia parasitica CBS 223.65]|uniref:N-acetyltransferase domain-containing protein n=1 Tax=Saprolegnia parasitica (strain CBS 223.65) TaxID=695850 RepID=A0A067CGP8_SAPPC|nr:hypothetical protein SPRG_08650 [Saprolegnia parasitica CBS 223.65]KDO25997.1 hypothetical protein SPRG_08650 [Saprolegnia parasitica CBS 223.65]|eukprot:XP_012203284.1 hypothetical protein SPRG_08650 [Saprolegnia parasitica CBS 223.65]
MNWQRFQTTEFGAIVDNVITAPWATMTSTPTNPEHYMANCIYVDASVLPPADTDLDAMETIQRQAHARVVYQFIDAKATMAPYASEWKTCLKARGLEIEMTPAWLLAFDLATQMVPAPIHATRVLTTVDEILDADGGASPYNSDAWCRHLRLQQLARGPSYGCFVSSVDSENNASVGVVSLHLASDGVAIVNWCGVPEAHRRHGHATSALVRALAYARDELHCTHVYLTAVDDGPIQLYQRVGFTIVDAGDEVQCLGPLLTP